MNANPLLVEALRGGIVESLHRGAVAIVDADGAVHTALGDIDRPIFPRSAVKVLQALPLVASGAETAMSMLAKAGVDFQSLECGTQWPSYDGATKALAAAHRQPNGLNNNCSGKHSGFVCVGCMMAQGRDVAAFVKGYVQPDHPVMREVTASLQAATGFDLSRAARGTDGCSIPTYAIPLRHLAHAFARVATGVGLSSSHASAAKRLRQAVAKAPFMVAGTGRMDTRVMERFGERVFCKVGAEGVYCAALPDLGLGVAIKMDDGNNARACEVAFAAVLERLLPLSAEDGTFLRSFSDATLKNWNGIEVGRLRAAASLRA
ncbi:MAG: asparaginase [Betaproteobacteria bacterium]|nr:asparaginase [Betaproteobacteria bacterium]